MYTLMSMLLIITLYVPHHTEEFYGSDITRWCEGLCKLQSIIIQMWENISPGHSIASRVKDHSLLRPRFYS